MSKLIYDTETTGFVNSKAPPSDLNQPHLVQIAGVLVDDGWYEQSSFSLIVLPDGFEIPEHVSDIHGVTTKRAQSNGVPLKTALSVFNNLARRADEVWAFNESFDRLVIESEFYRVGQASIFYEGKPSKCAMLACMNILKLPGKYGAYKWPKLAEAYAFFYNTAFEHAHDALADVRATVAVMKAVEEWNKMEKK